MNGEQQTWEEKSYIDQSKNSLENEEKDNCDITIETKNGLTKKGWNAIREKEYKKNWYQKNKWRWKIIYGKNKKEYLKQYYLKNKKKLSKRNKERYQRIKNTEEYKKRSRQYRLKTKDHQRKKQKEYRQKNKIILRIKDRIYEKRRRKNDISFRIKCNLRSGLYKAIKGNQKKGSAVSDLGCSIEELKHYLEKQFIKGMSWKNYGKWHIDHIKPLSSFCLTDRKQILEACHYTNLQPLWAEDNQKKSNKITWPEKSS